MALTRKLLKSMGLNEEQIDSVVEAHTETVDGLKADVKKYKTDAEKLPDIQKELDALKAKDNDGYEKKYNDEHAAFEKYKQDQTAKETHAAKEKALRTYFTSKNITGKNLEIAMRACKAELEAAELDGEAFKDTKSFDDLIAGDLSGLVTASRIRGPHTPTPPGNGGGTTMTRDQIMAIKDAEERQAAIADHMDLFE